MTTAEPHIALLDLYAGGHHRMYLELLVRQFIKQQVPGRLTIFLGPAFERVHVGFADTLRDMGHGRVSVFMLDELPDIREGALTLRQLLGNDRAHGVALEKVATHRPDHVVVMTFDHAQLTTARFRDTRISLWGIYFRASFHYHAESLATRFNHIRKKIVLRRAVRNMSLKGLFCLDPWAVEPVNKLAGRPVAVALPDGNTTSAHLKPPATSTTRTYLFFGVLSEWKGLGVVMNAWDKRPPGDARLIIAGRLSHDANPAFRSRVYAFSQRKDVTLYEKYISENELGTLFSSADVILIPYQSHIGSSNVLIKAAQAGRPVIGPSAGMVGRQIEKHSLGLALDCSSVDQLADALALPASAIPFDAAAARAFAADNTESRMANVFFQTLIPSWHP